MAEYNFVHGAENDTPLVHDDCPPGTFWLCKCLANNLAEVERRWELENRAGGGQALHVVREMTARLIDAVIPGRREGVEPQMCNCTSGNLEIPGSRWTRAPE
jgi:hypothetical protein